ncbi:helix-turn-helix domain-containing protein [Gemmiger sp.]|uniref:helix-turn-helix domain-containing protein n=1 Tax=Gemmiger sp. TaxID=2049027 RepID=UPI003F0853C7|nr:helix-turn-helix domain-containing protein [bacterium]MCI6175561.1 helix-turn-helix domain-containing protein [bacterium]MCI6520489.1 helix-turn-helix domain-containing protein [bacterium]
MENRLFALRLSALRQQKGVSAREMSLALGQNTNYINRIENGKNYPSMQSFFYICEYLGVTPQEFFEEKNAAPTRLNDLIVKLKRLTPSQLATVNAVVDELVQKR